METRPAAVNYTSEGTELEKYTVGWICALSMEMSAAMGMLDERHGIPRSLILIPTAIHWVGKVYAMSHCLSPGWGDRHDFGGMLCDSNAIYVKVPKIRADSGDRRWGAELRTRHSSGRRCGQ